MATRLNHLPDDCLLEVLDRLSPGQLMKIRQASQRMNQLALIKAQVKIKAIRIKGSGYNQSINYRYDRFSKYNHFDISRDKLLVLKPKSYNSNSCDKELDFKLFLSLLTKCPGVKSIDFCLFEFNDNHFVEVVKSLPQLDSVKLAKPFCSEYAFKQIGYKIRRLVCYCKVYSNTINQIRMLKMIAADCANIEQFDLMLEWSLTNDLAEALRVLPKSCRINVVCYDFNDPLQDVVDELVVETDLKWSALGHRYERLASLKFNRRRIENVGTLPGVVFAGLKKLDLTNTDCWFYDRETINCLVASRWPRLDELHLNACDCLGFASFDPVFERWSSVKKLILCFDRVFVLERLHESVALYLEKLEFIVLNIVKIDATLMDDWHLGKFLDQLEQYVDGISSLKKLVVEANSDLPEEWEEKLIDKVEQLKLKQQRVEIDLI